MRARLTKLAAGIAALAALAVGGSALATAGGGGQPAKPATPVQQGRVADPAAHDAAGKADAETNDGAASADTDAVQDNNGKDDATEPAETESEVAGGDGPGGYADEPGNPNADTQQQGEH